MQLYQSYIFKCKPISEVGAEQMLLDTHALGNTLVEMISVGLPEKLPAPTAFLKILTKRLGEIDQILKILLRPINQTQALIDNYLMIFGKSASSKHFSNILDLKGCKRADILYTMEIFSVQDPKNRANLEYSRGV